MKHEPGPTATCFEHDSRTKGVHSRIAQGKGFLSVPESAEFQTYVPGLVIQLQLESGSSYNRIFFEK